MNENIYELYIKKLLLGQAEINTKASKECIEYCINKFKIPVDKIIFLENKINYFNNNDYVVIDDNAELIKDIEEKNKIGVRIL